PPRAGRGAPGALRGADPGPGPPVAVVGGPPGRAVGPRAVAQALTVPRRPRAAGRVKGAAAGPGPPGPPGRGRSRNPSRFLDDLVPPGGSRVRPRAVATGMTRTGRASVRADGPLAEQLRAWRRKRAEADGVPAYVVFNDRTLAALSERQPRSRGELLAVEGIGPSKLDRYGDELLALLSPSDGD